MAKKTVHSTPEPDRQSQKLGNPEFNRFLSGFSDRLFLQVSRPVPSTADFRPIRAAPLPYFGSLIIYLGVPDTLRITQYPRHHPMNSGSPNILGILHILINDGDDMDIGGCCPLWGQPPHTRRASIAHTMMVRGGKKGKLKTEVFLARRFFQIGEKFP